jgi:hypothetical protein
MRVSPCRRTLTSASFHTAHPVGLGPWWADALGWVVVWQSDDEYSIRPAPDRLPGLSFVTMLDAKVAKSRLHLDFHPDNQAAEVDRLVGMEVHRVNIARANSAGWCSQTRRATGSASSNLRMPPVFRPSR